MLAGYLILVIVHVALQFPLDHFTPDHKSLDSSVVPSVLVSLVISSAFCLPLTLVCRSSL
jgi:hypothetical protein